MVKAINPFCRFAGRHRSFLELHLAKSRRTSREAGTLLPHIVTTSYLTHSAIADYLEAEGNYGYPGPVLLSQGRSIGLRMVPTERDLRFAWQETAASGSGRAGSEDARKPAGGADLVGAARR